MPRTRSQAQAVKSPLVSLVTPPRKRKATTTTKSSASIQEEATAPKPKRGRKLSKKEVAPENASEESIRSKSEITETQGIETTQSQPQTQESHTQEPKGEEPIAEAAKDNGSTFLPTTPTAQIIPDASPISSKESTPSLCSPAKKRSLQKALSTVKEALKKSRQRIKQRLDRLKNSTELNEQLNEEPSEDPKTVADSESSPSTEYSFAENEVLDGALRIMLDRMEPNSFTTDPFMPSTIRCPCCQGALKFQCPKNHDLQSWVPDDAKEAMNAVLTTMFAEGIITTSEDKEKSRRAKEKAAAATSHQSEEPRKAAPQNEPSELSSKEKGKKRAREPHEDGLDEAPRAQRRRVTSSAGRTPFNNRRTPTGRRTPRTPANRRKMPYSEIRRRTLERERENAPSIFRLDEIVAQHEAREKAKKDEEEAAEAERLLAISRASMEQHAVIGPVPEDMRDSFEVTMHGDGRQHSNIPEAHEATEIPQTPEAHQVNETNQINETNQVNEIIQINEAPQAPETPRANTWGFDIRNFFNSVTGSVRRFVPSFGHARVPAVPFVAGGDATPIAANDATPTPANGNRDTSNLNYSLFAPRVQFPLPQSDSQPASAEGTAQNVEQGTTLATGRQNLQDSITNNVKHKDADKEPESASASNKRKRERPPSPDAIPNPPGCSYGLHDDYFTYSDDEIEEAEAYCAAEAAAASTSAERPEKRARFLSPEETQPEETTVRETTVAFEDLPFEQRIPPGWARPTTTVYTGRMFKGMNFGETHPRAPDPTPNKPFQFTPGMRSPSPLFSSSAQWWLSNARRNLTNVYGANPYHTNPYGTNPNGTNPGGLNLLPRKYKSRTRSPTRITGSLLTPQIRRELASRYSLTLEASRRRQSSFVNGYLETPGPSSIPAEPPLDSVSMPWNPTIPQTPTSIYDSHPTSQQQDAAITASENGTVSQLAAAPLMPQESNQQPCADSASSNESASEQQDAPINAPTNGLVAQPRAVRAVLENPVTPRPNATPETISLPPIIQPLSAALRGQSGTDIHKPALPSNLRNVMRLSSSPLSQPSPTTQQIPTPIAQQTPTAQQPSIAQQTPTVQQTPTLNLGEPSQQDLIRIFGDDEFGRQAYDIYKSCPSGDFNQLQWPTFETTAEDGVQQTIDGTALDESQQLANQDNLQQTSFEQFQNGLDQVLFDPDEIMGDLIL